MNSCTCLQVEAAKGVVDQDYQQQLSPEKHEGKLSVNNVLGKRKISAVTKVDGVGAGAVAAASLHADFDLEAHVALAKWKAGDPVPYAFLAATFNEIAPQSKRLGIIATLTNSMRCIVSLTPSDLLPMVYLCTSKVCPVCHLLCAMLATRHNFHPTHLSNSWPLPNMIELLAGCTSTFWD